MKIVKIILNSIVISLIGVFIWKNTFSATQTYHVNTSGAKSWLTDGMIIMLVITLVILGVITLIMHFLPDEKHHENN